MEFFMLDITSYVNDEDDGSFSLQASVSGMHCISCARVIENKLNSYDEIKTARVNVSANRLNFTWQGSKELGNELLDAVNKLGYKAQPYTPLATDIADEHESKTLLKALAVSGFAMGTIMMFSFAVWASNDGDMGETMRKMMHWISGAIAIPTVFYAGRPFFKSAWLVLKNRHTNMDVPISVAILLATGLSIYEVLFTNSEDVYFDSAVMLIFFLLIGRFLNVKARKKAKSAAAGLLTMMEGSATLIEGNKHKEIPIKDIQEKMLLQVTSGEKIPADGIVSTGSTEVDNSMLTGETLPEVVGEGSKVLAGMLNLGNTIQVRVSKPGDQSLLSDIIRLMEKAEQGESRFVRISDRVASFYSPVVHTLGLAAFLFWYFIADVGAHQAIINAVAVLIITCPCALGLAVPVVQVLGSSSLFKRGILIKSGDALEKLSEISTIVFDKTGTLTSGHPELCEHGLSDDDYQLAASMAAQSKHPLSKALAKAYKGQLIKGMTIEEISGHGLMAEYKGKKVMLGKRDWLTAENTDVSNDQLLELWFKIDNAKPQRLTFEDQIRTDAVSVVEKLKARKFGLHIFSGDRKGVVQNIAQQIGVDSYHAKVLPDDKCREIDNLKRHGEHVLMVGDGLNDAPALASAHVSMSPSTAMDITQNAADIVFQGDKLAPVVEAYEISLISNALTKQNIALAVLYNVFAIPVAFMGFVTPMIAAIAMSGSSIVVVFNALRLNSLVKRRLSKKI